MKMIKVWYKNRKVLECAWQTTALQLKARSSGQEQSSIHHLEACLKCRLSDTSSKLLE